MKEASAPVLLMIFCGSFSLLGFHDWGLKGLLVGPGIFVLAVLLGLCLEGLLNEVQRRL